LLRGHAYPSTGTRTLQPVLIPHTRLCIRLAANPQTTTIHPSVVKEQVGPHGSRRKESDAS